MELNSNLQSVRHMDSLGMDILNHRRAAAFLNKAAQLHQEAAKQRLQGNLEEASERIQGAKDLLLQVSAIQQGAWFNLEAAKQRQGGISNIAENQTVQNLQRQFTAMQQENESTVLM